MNYGRANTKKILKQSVSKSKKYGNKFLISLGEAVFIISIIFFIMLLSAGLGVFMGIIHNTPRINIESIVPLGFSTSVYDAQGNLTDTLVMEGSNREEAAYEELPQDLIDAFVAIEDERFWKHKGIDTKSIMRAVFGVINGNSSLGGGSTITQQLIKNNVFKGGRERSFGAKIERKLQEQYLALELEKTMDKKMILTNYLNTINLGNNTLGVKVASKRYFDKDVSELTLSESAVIAGITQNPSKLNPISGREANEAKRKIILQYMFEQGYITKEEQEEALGDNVYDRIQNVDLISKSTINTYSYFTDELIDQVKNTLVEKLGYTETQAHNLIYGGGLSIYTTQDPDLQKIVDEEVNDPQNYDAAKLSVEFRLSVKHANGETEHYSENTLRSYHRDVLKDNYDGLYLSEEEAKADVDAYKAYLLKEGDEILGEKYQTLLQPQTSFVLIEQSTGQVKAISGGRGAKTASLTLNRATDDPRQPGSTFKIISTFAPALDASGKTLASVYYDEPYTVGTKNISNWYSKQGYLGYSSIREGIIYSMNIVAVRTLMETVTPSLGVDYAKKFGITTLEDKDYTASLALGGLTKGVNNLELTGAFSAIANGGIYTKPIFFTKILDHNGKVLYEDEEETHRIIKDSTAFLLTDAMAASMVPNKKFARGGVSVNSTGTRAHLDHMSCAGKSGTTSDSVDVWFVGFTPYYTAGIWGGCDDRQVLSEDNGGVNFHKEIWKKIMTRVHEGKPDIGFPVPDSIETATICRKSGKLPISGICKYDPRGDATYTEYFEKGTIPDEICDAHTSMTVCADSMQKPTEFCTNLSSRVITILPKGNTNATDDSVFSWPGTCSIHTGVPAESAPEASLDSPPKEKNSSAQPIGPGYQTLSPN
ncbi:MAG: transglycosylase domain-containing protein [Johnsonella sp.]|nr:transglycosylase domain-containing protein [Johnsonella sp.]